MAEHVIGSHVDPAKIQCPICRKKFKRVADISSHLGGAHNVSGPKGLELCAELLGNYKLTLRVFF